MWRGVNLDHSHELIKMIATWSTFVIVIYTHTCVCVYNIYIYIYIYVYMLHADIFHIKIGYFAVNHFCD